MEVSIDKEIIISAIAANYNISEIAVDLSKYSNRQILESLEYYLKYRDGRLLWNRNSICKMEVNDMDFEELIAEALEEMSERNERVMKNFFYRIGYKGIVGYENDLGKNVFTIWTDKPGILIGKGGQNVWILKDILKEEFGYDYEIKFKEIKGKMLVIV